MRHDFSVSFLDPNLDMMSSCAPMHLLTLSESYLSLNTYVDLVNPSEVMGSCQFPKLEILIQDFLFVSLFGFYMPTSTNIPILNVLNEFHA